MYESFYKLKEKPFSLLPDTDYLYLSRKHGTALALLEYSLLKQDGFCVISGEAGVGKTTLIRRLLAQHADRITIGLISNTLGSLGELLGWITVAFGLEYQDRTRSQLHDGFLQFLADQHAQNRQTVLIIDEAQNISAAMLAELQTLSKVIVGANQALKTILVGQLQLRATLRAPGLEHFTKHIVVDYHLGPLGRDETGEYIRHRLSVAGGDPGIFDDEACDAVFHYSGGIPRLTNLLCDNALACAQALKQTVVGADIVHTIMRDREARGTLPQFATGRAAGTPLQKMPATGELATEVLQALKHKAAVGEMPDASQPARAGLNDAGEDRQHAAIGKLINIENWPRNERRATIRHRMARPGGERLEWETIESRSSAAASVVPSASETMPNSGVERRSQAIDSEGVLSDDTAIADLEGREDMEKYQMIALTGDRRSRVFWGGAVMLGFTAGLLVAAILIGAAYLSMDLRAAPVGESLAPVAPLAPVAAKPPALLPPAPTPVAATQSVPAATPRSVDKARLRELRNERDAAITEARALQKERDAALAVAQARERAAKAELRAALAEERAQAALRRRSSPVVVEPSSVQAAAPAAHPKRVAEAALPVARRPSPPSVPSGASAVIKFSPNPCNGPAAKFLSTCKE